MNDTVDRFYQATGELMVKAADYDAISARCEELERRLAGAEAERDEALRKLRDWMDTADALYRAFPEAYQRGQLPENAKRTPSDMVREELTALRADLARAKERKPVAQVGFSCGRHYLEVGGVVVAMEGDACRQMLPSEVATEIPQEELEGACIGERRAIDLPIDVVRFFRGDQWAEKSLRWAADTINSAALSASAGGEGVQQPQHEEGGE